MARSDTYTTFVTNFATDMAAALGVTADRITVNGVAAGSVFVDFTVQPDAGGTPICDGDGACNVVTAFSAPGVSIAGATTETTITDDDMAFAVPAAVCRCFPTYRLGNGFCDTQCNTAECNFDSGDCDPLASNLDSPAQGLDSLTPEQKREAIELAVEFIGRRNAEYV
jgi:hypothetical protein